MMFTLFDWCKDTTKFSCFHQTYLKIVLDFGRKIDHFKVFFNTPNDELPPNDLFIF